MVGPGHITIESVVVVVVVVVDCGVVAVAVVVESVVGDCGVVVAAAAVVVVGVGIVIEKDVVVGVRVIPAEGHDSCWLVV